LLGVAAAVATLAVAVVVVDTGKVHFL